MEIKNIKIEELNKEQKQICSKCNKLQSLNNFYFRRDTNKYRKICKICHSRQMKEYRKRNWNKLLLAKKEWVLKNPEKRKAIVKRYYLKNKKKLLEYNKIYLKEKRNMNLIIMSRLRSRISKALKGIKKTIKIKELIGCDIKTLRIYLENKFKKGMTWENYGKWHIDHIIPCSAFDLTKEEEQMRCFNYKNLQPLWAKENQLKRWKKYEPTKS